LEGLLLFVFDKNTPFFTLKCEKVNQYRYFRHFFPQKLNNFCTKTQEFSPKLNTILLKTQFSGNSTNFNCRKNAEIKSLL